MIPFSYPIEEEWFLYLFRGRRRGQDLAFPADPAASAGSFTPA